MTPKQMLHYERLEFTPYSSKSVGLFVTTNGSLVVSNGNTTLIVKKAPGGRYTKTSRVLDGELEGCLVKCLSFPEIEIPPCPN